MEESSDDEEGGIAIEAAIATACSRGNNALVKVLEKCKNHESFMGSYDYEHCSIYEYNYLKDFLNHGLRCASKHGCVESVRAFLQDDRIEPSSEDNTAFCEAAGEGHVDVAKELLADARFKPGDALERGLRGAIRGRST